jgi:hypothetical protein
MKIRCFYFVLIISILSCTEKNIPTKIEIEKPKPVVSKPIPPTPTPPTPADDPMPAVELFLSRGACYGKCPVFEVSVMSNGTAEYVGKFNVTRMGKHVANVPPALLKTIKERAQSINYLQFSRTYPTEQSLWISDVPTTVTFVRLGDQFHKIRNNNDAPLTLISFEQFLEQILDGLEWKPMKE